MLLRTGLAGRAGRGVSGVAVARCAALGAALAAGAAAQTPPWYNTSWSNRKAVTILSSRVAGSLTNFPVLFSVADGNLKTVANGGKVGRTDGGDILFTAGDGVTKLNHEVEQYHAATGQLVAWVQAPALSASANTTLYVYYGNAGAASQQNAAGVWSNGFTGVWHLGDGMTLSAADSTASGFHGTVSGATAGSGQMGGGASFSGNSQYITVNTGSNALSGSFTLEAWAKPGDTLTRAMAGSRGPNDASLDVKFMNGTTVHADIGNGTSWLTTGADVGLSYTNSWYHVVYAVTPSGYTAYVNGVQASAAGFSGTPLLYDANHTLRIGQSGFQYAPEWFLGSIDEVRVSNVARAGAWVTTEYNNQSSPGTFYNVGVQENVGGGTPITVTSAPGGLTLTVDGVNCTAPCTFQWTAGTSHTIGAVSPQAGGTGVQYVFASWSDSGAASHSVTAPATATTYTATFATQYQLTTGVSPVGAGTIQPASGWHNSGAVVAVSASAGSGYQFGGFSGALSGTATPQNLTMTGPASVTAVFTAQGGGASWYNTSWSNRKAVTILSSRVAGSLTNFPVLFSVTDGNLKTVANGGKVGRTDGGDILFTAGDGVTKLNHEVERYNPATGQLAAWVQAPALSASADTTLYVYYGNAGATSQQHAAGVWSNGFTGVWHLGDGTTLSASDSTASGFHGTVSGATAGAGQLGGGASFSGNSQYITANTGSNALSGSFTLEAWAKPGDTLTRAIAGSRGPNDASLDVKFMNGTSLHGDIGNGTSWLTTGADAGLSYTNAWYHVVYAVTPSGYTIYVNGVQMSAAGFSGTPLLYDANHTLRIGQSGFWYAPEWFLGSIDEVRVSNVARTAAWVGTEYNNQSSPGTFYSVGAQESPGGGGGITVTSAPGGLTLTVDGVNCTAPCTFQWTAGTSHTIAASSPQAGGTGVQYVFVNWSDGGAGSHSVTAPATATTYTATFKTQYQLTTGVSPVGAGTIQPGSGWQDSGVVVAVSASAGTGYQFGGFSGALSGTATPQNLTMTGPLAVTANFTGPGGTFPTIRLNSGGTQSYTEPGTGIVWAADPCEARGLSMFPTTAPISGTSTPELYRDECYSYSPITYQFDNVPAGTYKVKLKFAEISHLESAGTRLMHVDINGVRRQSNLDVYMAAGGYDAAMDREFTVTVTVEGAGTIVVTLTPVASSAILSAIEVAAAALPVPVTVTPSSVPGYLAPLQTVQFTSNQAVNWFANEGTITDTGLYTAPSYIETRHQAQITAVSQSDAANFASVAVILGTESSPGAIYCAGFEDVGGQDPSCPYVKFMKDMVITTGCTANTFCANQYITRGQAAVFIVRGLYWALGRDPEGFTTSQTPYFGDVDAAHPYFRYVQKMRELGLTDGCGGGDYCPDETFTWGHIGVFTARAWQMRSEGAWDTTVPAAFADVQPAHVWYKYIQTLRRRQVINMGCGLDEDGEANAGYYCPDRPITRLRVAEFIVRGVMGVADPPTYNGSSTVGGTDCPKGGGSGGGGSPTVREYIRLGSRVIAVETTGGAASPGTLPGVSITPRGKRLAPGTTQTFSLEPASPPQTVQWSLVADPDGVYQGTVGGVPGPSTVYTAPPIPEDRQMLRTTIKAKKPGEWCVMTPITILPAGSSQLQSSGGAAGVEGPGKEAERSMTAAAGESASAPVIIPAPVTPRVIGVYRQNDANCQSPATFCADFTHPNLGSLTTLEFRIGGMQDGCWVVWTAAEGFGLYSNRGGALERLPAAGSVENERCRLERTGTGWADLSNHPVTRGTYRRLSLNVVPHLALGGCRAVQARGTDDQNRGSEWGPARQACMGIVSRTYGPVRVHPREAAVAPGAQQRFDAFVPGGASGAVAWSRGQDVGALSAGGTATARFGAPAERRAGVGQATVRAEFPGLTAGTATVDLATAPAAHWAGFALPAQMSAGEARGFTFEVSDRQGAENVTQGGLFFTGSPYEEATGCHVYWDGEANRFHLSGAVTVTAAAETNGECTLHVGQSWAQKLGGTVRLNAAVSFASGGRTRYVWVAGHNKQGFETGPVLIPAGRIRMP